MSNANRRFVLAARPTGLAGPEHFDEQTLPVRAPESGELLLETLYLSVDPAMRVWISENPGYVPRIELGDTMRGFGISRVLISRDSRFDTGDLVQTRAGWQSHPTVKADDVETFDATIGTPEAWMGLLGMTGLTAYFGLRDVGAVRPGETVLVSGAAGAVGQVVGQIANIEQCRVVGLAGGPDKCAALLRDHGFHAAIDYKAEPDLAAAIARACPGGVDVFYDNVGGPTLDAAIANLRIGGRVVICGRISQTAAAELYGVKNLGLLIGRRARIQGFVVTDFAARFAEGRTWLAGQHAAGRLHQHLHVLDGLDQAPVGLGMLFRGENTGKLVVRVNG
jgi:hypothetical protein